CYHLPYGRAMACRQARSAHLSAPARVAPPRPAVLGERRVPEEKMRHPKRCRPKSRMDAEAAAAQARALELRARWRAEGAFERCDDLMKTDGELITKSREMIDLARRRLQQVPELEQFTP